METTLEYMLRMEEELRSTSHRTDCTYVAYQVAQRLLKEEHAPSIATIPAPAHGLKPARYPHITWNYHEVCVSGGLVWDPMMGLPLPVERYGVEAFGQPIDMVETVSAAEMQRRHYPFPYW